MNYRPAFYAAEIDRTISLSVEDDLEDLEVHSLPN
jgi:hypothetical protein